MKSIAFLPALAALTAAIPHAKRDLVWVTATNVVTVVEEQTQTIWINADGTTSTPSPEPVVKPQEQEKYVAPPVVQAKPHNHANHHQAQNQHAPVENVKPAPAPAPTSSPPPAPVEPEPVTSTTSVYYAPAPTTPATHPQAAPQTTAAPAPQVQTSAPAPAPQQYSPPAQPAYSPPQSGSGSGSSSGSGNCADQSGTCTSAKFTYYTPGMGSCGQVNSDSDYVFAYGKDLMAAKGGANPNLNPLCGRKIQIKAHDGSMVTARLVDTCYACGSQDGMLDLSTDLWNKVAGDSGADGVMNGMEFTWM